MNKTLQWSGFLVAALVIIGAVVLAALDKTVPTELWSFGALALGVGAGATVPASHVTE